MRGLNDGLADLHHLLPTVTPRNPGVQLPPQQCDVTEVVELDCKMEQHDVTRMVVVAKHRIGQNESLTRFLPILGDSKAQYIFVFVGLHDGFHANSELQEHNNKLVLLIVRVHQLLKRIQQSIAQMLGLGSFRLQFGESLIANVVHTHLEFAKPAVLFHVLSEYETTSVGTSSVKKY